MVSQNLLPTSSYTLCTIQCVPEHGMNHRFFIVEQAYLPGTQRPFPPSSSNYFT